MPYNNIYRAVQRDFAAVIVGFGAVLIFAACKFAGVI